VLYTWNDFVVPLLYVGRTPINGWRRSGLAQFRGMHQVQWNLTMAATLLVIAPGNDRTSLRRPDGLRRGLTLTGVKG